MGGPQETFGEATCIRQSQISIVLFCVISASLIADNRLNVVDEFSSSSYRVVTQLQKSTRLNDHYNCVS